MSGEIPKFQSAACKCCNIHVAFKWLVILVLWLGSEKFKLLNISHTSHTVWYKSGVTYLGYVDIEIFQASWILSVALSFSLPCSLPPSVRFILPSSFNLTICPSFPPILLFGSLRLPSSLNLSYQPSTVKTSFYSSLATWHILLINWDLKYFHPFVFSVTHWMTCWPSLTLITPLEQIVMTSHSFARHLCNKPRVELVKIKQTKQKLTQTNISAKVSVWNGNQTLSWWLNHWYSTQ